jgi:biotin carboxylase
MRAIFMNEYDFLVEEYIEGPEFSFETVVLDDAWHMCIQEKARVERLERTTLEAMSVSPPSSVTQEVLLRGADFVSHCFAELKGLGLTAGAFHVEAKYWADRDRWEIIEINPRLGGSLINASVQALTGESILELWMESLTLADSELDTFRARLKQVSQLEALRNGTATKATVFLSKYGKRGKVIESIYFEPVVRKPQILKVHVSPGTKLDDSDRAICLMDALWEVDTENLAAEIDLLDRQATEHFHVQYR